MGAIEADPIPVRLGGGERPLSPAQERMWLLDRLEADAGAYNVFLAHRLRGDLDADRLAAAVGAIAARHEILRTTYASRDGEPVQIVREPGDGVPLERLDLSGLPAGSREARARELAAERIRRPFDLAAGPPWRASLLRLDEREHVLCVVFHHIAVDGWSTELFSAELAALYPDPYGQAPAPPALQYGDYAAWQRERLAEEAAGQLAYWRDRLADPPVLDLPLDRPRPATRGAA
ncbi:condensation domain-containing protein, partial [Nonomuraea antimicrobica]|uniref:condensation domain-containing protein n=1 Tax=Nonomuraea antimicrobica TaxID=561173 RepID=UPI0031F0B6D7